MSYFLFSRVSQPNLQLVGKLSQFFALIRQILCLLSKLTAYLPYLVLSQNGTWRCLMDDIYHISGFSLPGFFRHFNFNFFLLYSSSWCLNVASSFFRSSFSWSKPAGDEHNVRATNPILFSLHWFVSTALTFFSSLFLTLPAFWNICECLEVSR